MRSLHLSRRAGVLALLAFAVLGPSAASAVNPGPPPLPISGPGPSVPVVKGVSTTLSTYRAGAKPVVVSLVVQVPLICGHPVGTTTVTLPAAADVPASIAPAAVTVNTLPVTKLSVAGSTVTIAGPALHGIMCHSVTEGTMRVLFGRAAGIGNPARAGTYGVVVKHGLDVQHGTFTIR